MCLHINKMLYLLYLLTHLLWILTNVNISGLYKACMKHFNLLLNVVNNSTIQFGFHYLGKHIKFG